MPMTVTPGTDSIMLGDTLTVTIEIPFDNINTRDNSRIDISRSTTSEFGIDHVILVNMGDTSIRGYGLDQFKIIYEKGGGGVHAE
jgi:flagellar basal body L-ring protein FlgH